MGRKIRVEIVLKFKKLNNHNPKDLIKFTLLWVGLSMASLCQAETIKVCYDQWPPMTIFPTQTSPERGVVIDMLEHIYTSKGYTLEYYEVPLARGLEMVAEGLCDMLPEYLFSPNTQNTFEFASEETFSYPTAFVVRADDPWRYNGIESIKGKRVATGPGWDYSSMSVDYQNYLDDPKNIKYVEIIAGYDDVIDRAMRMIKENRIDLYADNELVLQHVLNRIKLNKDLEIVRPGLETNLVEIPIFSKKIPAEKRQLLIDVWNEGRIAMKGEKEKMLLKKYNVAFK